MRHQFWNTTITSVGSGLLFLLARTAGGATIGDSWLMAAGVVLVTAIMQLLQLLVGFLLRAAKAWPGELDDLRSIMNDCVRDHSLRVRQLDAVDWFRSEEDDLGPASEIHTLTNDLASIDCDPTLIAYVARNITRGSHYYYYLPSVSHVEAMVTILARSLVALKVQDVAPVLGRHLHIRHLRKPLLFNFSLIVNPGVAKHANWYFITPPVPHAVGPVTVDVIDLNAPHKDDLESVFKRLKSRTCSSRMTPRTVRRIARTVL